MEDPFARRCLTKSGASVRLKVTEIVRLAVSRTIFSYRNRKFAFAHRASFGCQAGSDGIPRQDARRIKVPVQKGKEEHLQGSEM